MKALEPAPERMTTRVSGELERKEKRGGSSLHILCQLESVIGHIEESVERLSTVL